jgi:hypothetical protein
VFLSDYVNDVQEILHDSTQSVWPLARVISRINEARLNTALDTHCIRFNVTGIQLIEGVEIYPLNGAIVGANITNGGSGYGGGSTVGVTFTAAPAGGTTATATGTLTGGSLSAITMTQWGSGYTSVPTITIGGIGSGAAATSVPLFRSNALSTVIGNPITLTKISIIWNLQRFQLKYADFTMFDAYARQWATPSFNAPPGMWTHHLQGQQIYIQPPPDQLYMSEWDVIYMPAPLVNTTDFDNDLIDPWQRAVQWGASAKLLAKLRNMRDVEEMSQQYERYIPRVITTTAGIRIPNIYNKNFQRRIMR